MKRVFVLTASVVLAATAVYADDDFIADCEEFKAANGVGGDCECMAEAATEAGVADEIMAIETIDEIDSLSDEAKAAVDSCQ